GDLHAMELSSHHIEQSSYLKFIYVLLYDIEYPADLHAIDARRIASDNIQREFIDHLSTHTAMGTESGCKRKLVGLIREEFGQVKTLHHLPGRKKKFGHPGFFHFVRNRYRVELIRGRVNRNRQIQIRSRRKRNNRIQVRYLT